MSSGFSPFFKRHFYRTFYSLTTVEWTIIRTFITEGLDCPFAHRYGSEGSAFSFLAVRLYNSKTIHMEPIVLNFMNSSIKVVGVSPSFFDWLFADATPPFTLRYRADNRSEDGKFDYSIGSHALSISFFSSSFPLISPRMYFTAFSAFELAVTISRLSFSSSFIQFWM